MSSTSVNMTFNNNIYKTDYSFRYIVLLTDIEEKLLLLLNYTKLNTKNNVNITGNLISNLLLGYKDLTENYNNITNKNSILTNNIHTNSSTSSTINNKDKNHDFNTFKSNYIEHTNKLDSLLNDSTHATIAIVKTIEQLSLLLTQTKNELMNYNTYSKFAETLNTHFEKEEALKSAINKAAAARSERTELEDELQKMKARKIRDIGECNSIISELSKEVATLSEDSIHNQEIETKDGISKLQEINRFMSITKNKLELESDFLETSLAKENTLNTRVTDFIIRANSKVNGEYSLNQEQINLRIVKANKELKQIEAERAGIYQTLELYRERMRLYQADIEVKEALERKNMKVAPLEVIDKDIQELRLKKVIILQRWWRKKAETLKKDRKGVKEGKKSSKKSSKTVLKSSKKKKINDKN